MNAGRLIAVVGASGVGKDSVMAGIVAVRPGIKLVKRAITRAAGLGGEDYDAVAPDEFEAAVQSGAFCLHWDAHGLRYGIPAQVLKDVEAGEICIANLSRGALPDANAVFPAMTVLHVTATPQTLAERLEKRGRESAEDIAKRLGRTRPDFPGDLDVIEISNDGALSDAVAAALDALQPVRA